VGLEARNSQNGPGRGGLFPTKTILSCIYVLPILINWAIAILVEAWYSLPLDYNK
jgi:hypothetical protein